MARQWLPLARMIEATGYTTIEGIHNFKNRRIHWALRSFKPLEGLIGPYLGQCARYMETPQATVARLAKVARECQREMQWGRIVMHPNCLEELVHPSRSMLCRHREMHYQIIKLCSLWRNFASPLPIWREHQIFLANRKHLRDCYVAASYQGDWCTEVPLCRLGVY